MVRELVLPILFLIVHLTYGQSALAVETVTITVSDLEISVPFYEEVLDFKKIHSYTLEGKEFQHLVGISNEKLSVKIVELQLGNETIALQEFVNETQSRAIPLDSKSNDFWFQHIAIVVSDMEKGYKKLWDAEVVHVSSAPQTLPDYIPEATGIKAFYFQDPDGHNLELIYFPKGKGNPKWQQSNDAIFMGIDHTAIGIERTAPSSEFYIDQLGLKISGHSENYGPEQEHLNQVFGARLYISSLRAKEGMGIEFLDYIAPPGGRAYPADSTPTDLWHWHTTLKVADIQSIYKALRKTNAAFVSDGMTTIHSKKKFMIRDTDGHAVLITE